MTEKLRFLNSQGEVIQAPGEWEPALIEVQIPIEQRQYVRLLLGGKLLKTRLEELRGQERILATWERANPGHYSLTLEFQDKEEKLPITVPTRKISPEAYAQLLEDLETSLPVTVAIALQKLGALSGIHFLPLRETTLAEELHRLERAIAGMENRPGLAKILSALATNPHQILKTHERWVNQHQVRRPSISGLAQALYCGKNLDAQGKPLKVLDQRVEHTFDVYENQLVKQLVSQVELRLRRFLRSLAHLEETKTSPRRNPISLQDALQRGKSLEKQLDLAKRQAHFLQTVSRLKCPPDRLTMVLLKRPFYYAALKTYLELNRCAAVRIEEPALETPLEKLPYLYQIWSTLQITQVLLKVAQEQEYQVVHQQLIRKDPTGFYLRVLPGNQPILQLMHPHYQTQLTLIHERKYGTSGELQCGTRHEQRPDIALEVKRPDGNYDVYLFDPKYKLDSERLTKDPGTGEPKKDDTDKMHTYRDAIRDRAGRRVVRYAALLYPGRYINYPNAGIDALPTCPICQEELQQHLERILRGAIAPSLSPDLWHGLQ